MTHTPVKPAGGAHIAGALPAPLGRADANGLKRPAGAHRQLATIREERVGRRVVLSIAGELDISNASDLGAAIEDAGARAFDIWLDLSATTFMDSTALNSIAQARRRLSRANLRIAVICPEGPVHRLLKLTGFERIVDIHATRTAANHATSG